jgi:leucyl/phenylalanyl-tRNA--protein transferase
MGDRDGVVRWYSADPRGILPLDRFHVSKTLGQLVRNPGKFEVRINHDFAGTMRACGNARREGTWINAKLIAAYQKLHELGYAHSVETYWENELVGGLYGVSLGGAFFGESMFHHRRDASKLALVHLVSRLKERGYELLDAQASTEHLRRFGCIEIAAGEYLKRLEQALKRRCEFGG